MGRGVYSPEERVVRHAASTPAFSSVWQIGRGTGFAFKIPPSLTRYPFSGVRPPRYVLCKSSGSLAIFAARLVFGDQLGRRSPAGLVFEVDVSELLSVSVVHDIVVRLHLSRPRRREAASDSYFDSDQSTDQPRFCIVEPLSSPQM